MYKCIHILYLHMYVCIYIYISHTKKTNKTHHTKPIRKIKTIKKKKEHTSKTWITRKFPSNIDTPTSLNKTPTAKQRKNKDEKTHR